MVIQFRMPAQDQAGQSSLLVNASLISALRTLIGQVSRFADSDQPKILCLGRNSHLIPELVTNRFLRELNCWFVCEDRWTMWKGHQATLPKTALPDPRPSLADAIVLSIDEQSDLTPMRLRQIKLRLKPQGRLIVVAPYRASVIELLQKSLKTTSPVEQALRQPRAISVSWLFRLFEAEGYTDPYLRLVGGLPGFWESAVCSVTPQW
ncbi:MAG: hypothetical protein ACFB5Z_09200 [Elainellaceae cyanobacterium]